MPDVRDIDAGLGPVDMLHAGYPCQPFSQLGYLRGEEDPRHLWPHIAAAIRLLRPRVVVLENVAAHLRLGFASVLSDLSSMGFDARWGVVRGSVVGTPHTRARLFVVATDTARVGSVRARTAWDGRPGSQNGHPDSRYQDWCEYADAIRRWERISGRPAPAPVDARRRLAPEFVEWMQGFPPGWTEGVPRYARLVMLGNAVVPQQAHLALSLLAAPDPEVRRVDFAA